MRANKQRNKKIVAIVRVNRILQVKMIRRNNKIKESELHQMSQRKVMFLKNLNLRFNKRRRRIAQIAIRIQRVEANQILIQIRKLKSQNQRNNRKSKTVMIQKMNQKKMKKKRKEKALLNKENYLLEI